MCTYKSTKIVVKNGDKIFEQILLATLYLPINANIHIYNFITSQKKREMLLLLCTSKCKYDCKDYIYSWVLLTGSSVIKFNFNILTIYTPNRFLRRNCKY